NARDGNGATPLHYAAEKAYIPIADLLLSNKADPNIQDDDADTPLHWAIKQPSITYNLIKDKLIDLFELFIQHGASKDQLNVVKLLIQNGAHVNEKGMHGATPLHYAADNVNTSIAGLLLSNKADPNIQDDDADTPL
ncbi:hypothetical protein CAPTEDRAFT_48439, partial [Capitella teleta]